MNRKLRYWEEGAINKRDTIYKMSQKSSWSIFLDKWFFPTILCTLIFLFYWWISPLEWGNYWLASPIFCSLIVIAVTESEK